MVPWLSLPFVTDFVWPEQIALSRPLCDEAGQQITKFSRCFLKKLVRDMETKAGGDADAQPRHGTAERWRALPGDFENLSDQYFQVAWEEKIHSLGPVECG